MWIKNATIVGFGQWQKQRFDFVDGLQVVQGLNEAGKTTLHQFLLGMLFGFPQAKGRKVNTYEPLEQGPYGGHLQFEVNGTTYELTRLGRTQTTTRLVAVETQQEFADPEGVLTELLGPVDRDLYQAVFSFDQDALTQIFALRPDEFAEHLRLLATPGSEQWLAIANQWEQEAVSQFGVTKTARRPINEALQTLQIAQDNLQTAIAARPSLRALSEQQQTAQARLATLTERQRNLSTDLSSQAKQQQLVPIYQRWQQLTAQLADAPEPIDTRLADEAEQVQQQLLALETVSVEATVSDEQLDTATQAVNALEQLNQQQREAARRQADIQNQTSLLLAKYRWQVFPPELTPFQVNQLQGGPQIAVSGQYQRAGIGAIAFGIVAGLGLMLGHQVLPGILAIILLGAIGAFLFFKLPKRVTASTDLPAEYGDMTPEMVLNAQPDVRLGHQMAHQLADLMAAQQAMMPQHKALEEKLAWLGYQLSESDYRQKLAELRANNRTADQQVVQKAKLQQRLNELLQVLGVTSVGELLQQRELAARTQAMNQEADLLRGQLGDADLNALATASETVDDTDPSAVALRLQEEVNDVQQTLARLEAQQQRLMTDTSIETQQQQIADQTAAITADLKAYFVNRLANEWVAKALDAAIGDRFPQLIHYAGDLLQRLTQGNYTQISQTKTLIKVTRHDGAVFNVSQLSKGAAEQVYVALRLAFVQAVKESIQLPLLIDDAFVDFDRERRQAMIDMLQEMAGNHQQVLYFTAHQVAADNVLDLNELKGASK
ncbi:ATP-binding protein [Weissella confusa]|uniref:ATP-binding protein n=1 Tax=Weissella confusa TaxID=1583 RepID=UPI0018F1E692|nr:AAA family ATPase [Weissella confusa]MBJ7662978.1 AAA family ATPase [Weissella confusa]